MTPVDLSQTVFLICVRQVNQSAVLAGQRGSLFFGGPKKKSPPKAKNDKSPKSPDLFMRTASDPNSYARTPDLSTQEQTGWQRTPSLSVSPQEVRGYKQEFAGWISNTREFEVESKEQVFGQQIVLYIVLRCASMPEDSQHACCDMFKLRAACCMSIQKQGHEPAYTAE